MKKRSLLSYAVSVARKKGAALPAAWSWERVRDSIDLATGSELDTFLLDLATDTAIKVRDRANRKVTE